MSNVPDLASVDIIHTEVLWGVQIRQSDDMPWSDYGTYKSSWEDQLRVHDYREENFPEDQCRLIRAIVLRCEENPEKLRELLRQKTSEEASSDLPSN